MKGAAASDHDPHREGSYLRDEEDVVRAGGITAPEVAALDAGWGRLGFKSRTAMIRKETDAMLA